jgi:hypothetical protein
MDDCTSVPSENEEGKQRAKEEICHLQAITRPQVFGMVPQEGSPVLPYSSRCARMPHLLLHGTCRDLHAQLEECTTKTLSSPKAILHCHFLDESHGFCGDLWFGRCCSGRVFLVKLESLAMPPQERLWLDDEKRLLPCSSHACQSHQKHAIGARASRSFDLSAQDNQLLAQERMFCHTLGRASGKVSQRSQDESGVGWFGPVDETVVERLKVKACQTRDEGENPRHSVRYPFVKMSR